jgi:glyoxylase-like metal-dependent hydrolase (beta-lactamase superfamily II)
MKIFPIITGAFLSDGGANFGVVPKMLWKEFYPADEFNFCNMVMRSLLISTKNKLVLLDTGVGNKHLDVMESYGFRNIINFEKELNAIGYSCNDVTDVVLSHLHFDHCGGCTWIDRNFELQMTFPNATHWASEAQWKNALNPNIAEENSYFLADIMPVFKKEKLRLVTEDTDISKDIKVKLFSGHTEEQLATYIRDKGKTVVFAGDVIPIAANVPLDWLSSYDIDKIKAMEGKQKMLEGAVTEEHILVFVHDAYTECATIEKKQDYVIKEKFRIKDLFL